MVMALIILIIKYKVCYVRRRGVHPCLVLLDHYGWLMDIMQAENYAPIQLFRQTLSLFVILVFVCFYLSFPMHGLSFIRLRVQLFSFIFDR